MNIGRLLLLNLLLLLHTRAAPAPSNWVVDDVAEIGAAVSDFRVGFCLLTEEKYQFVGYYDDRRRMTVAMRQLGESKWQYKVLPSTVGWDSHNYVTMAVDAGGHLHVSGNMHADPMVYFRASKPWDIQSLSAHVMTGKNEKRATYPRFLKDDQGRLLYNYRDGGSGNGKRIWNVYDESRQQWSRFHDSPLFDGQGKINAYPSGVKKGPDGRFHVVWVWRDTPDCATNHHLSYARTNDLKNWESSFGDSVDLPLSVDQKKLWVDPIPSGGGIINGGFRMVFDSKHRPLVIYHKLDANGHMQIYVARPEGGRWERKAITDWNKPVNFSGGGSMGFIGIRLGDVSMLESGVFAVEYRHKDYGQDHLFFSEESLEVVERKIQVPLPYPRKLNKKESSFKGMSIRRKEDLGASTEEGIRYILQWESLGSNHDKKRNPPYPKPSALKLYQLRRVAE